MNDEMKMGDEKDEFPIGLRVLSVDDNMTCLKILEAKLIQCKYHVTSTTSAIDALNILRKNKNNFDIIVTDVHMPDMDGFKLLEHVGLEMDLPCIMLSANDDPKIVMKGIEHGACDYLLKPVRVEELKNIWQHVIRKKKACKEQNNSDNATSEDGQGRKSHVRKRKEQNDDEEEEDEETTNESESMSKKKPRIVWTQELHHKFMDAIKVLGVNKAVPKKILEMMNVEGLSRENVASHLQKYRLYIKKLEEKANMMATMGLREQYLNPAARDSFNDFQAFSSSPNHLPTLQPYQQNTAFNRNNSGMLLGNNNNIARGLVPVARPPHMNNPINSPGSRFHNGNILQQMPSPSQTRLLLPENNSFNRFPTSAYQTHVNGKISMPLNSNMIHSSGTPNTLPMNNSMLSPKVMQSNPNQMNFSSSSGPVSHQNISGNNNNLRVDPMLMLSGTNDGSNYLNFGNTSQSHNRNITFGSQFGSQPLVDSNSSHSQRLNVVSNRVGMNANGQPNSNNMPLAQQCKFEKSSPDNPFKNKDDIFLDNSFFQGDLGSSGCSFSELENLIKPEAFGSSWPSDMKTDPFN